MHIYGSLVLFVTAKMWKPHNCQHENGQMIVYVYDEVLLSSSKDKLLTHAITNNMNDSQCITLSEINQMREYPLYDFIYVTFKNR